MSPTQPMRRLSSQSREAVPNASMLLRPGDESPPHMELGIYTFGDLVADPRTGRTITGQERMNQIFALAKIADEAGLDLMGVGEHHGLGYVNSATATMIAGLAAVTKKLRLTSASTLISTADPVRTFQEFATADLISHGRVELIFGRGAFVDNFPLFGFSLDDYDALFMEKLGLFAELNAKEKVTWTGRFRPPLRQAEIAPRPAQPRLPVWIGAGSPKSVMRAAALGYPLAIPMIGGQLPGYAQIADLYRRAWVDSGHPVDQARIALFSHLHLAPAAGLSKWDLFPYYSAYMAPAFGGAPMPSEAFQQMISPQGALNAGSPQEVIDKLMAQHEAIGMNRYFGQIDIGGQPFSKIADGIELFATKVAPVIRAETRKAAAAPAREPVGS